MWVCNYYRRAILSARRYTRDDMFSCLINPTEYRYQGSLIINYRVSGTVRITYITGTRYNVAEPSKCVIIYVTVKGIEIIYMYV